MDQPSTSSDTGECQQIKPENIGEQTADLLKRMIWKLKLDQTSPTNAIPLTNPVGRTARYTGMNKLNVEKVLAFGDVLDFEQMEIDRRIIHKQLISTYLVNNCIPTITELFNSLQDKLPIYVDVGYFTKILRKMGYVFYRFPGRKALHVIEKKSITFERCRYLKNIQRFRKDRTPIVYVGFFSVNHRMKVFNLERTLQTDTKYILKQVFFTATDTDIEHVKVCPPEPYEILKNTLKDWLSNIFVLHDLQPNTVCVLDDVKIFQDTIIKVPTWRSVKADMVEWLEEHNIPCNVDMRKSDLLQLIETCTDTKKNTFVIDNLAKIHNYTILRLPQCINGLSIAYLVSQHLNDRQYFNEFVGIAKTNVALKRIPEACLKMFSNNVQLEENKQLDEDIIVDNVWDGLVRNMKTLGSVANIESNEDDSILCYFSDSD